MSDPEKQPQSGDQLLIRGFLHELQIFDKVTGELVDSESKFNRIPLEGLDFLIQSPFGDVPAITQFYCGLFRNDYIPSRNTIAADIPAAMGEFVGYSEASRPIWDRLYNGDGTMNNVASKAIFTPTEDAVIYGSMIVSGSIKGSPSGIVLSAVRFNTIKQLSRGLEAKLVCGITYLPTNAI